MGKDIISNAPNGTGSEMELVAKEYRPLLDTIVEENRRQMAKAVEDFERLLAANQARRSPGARAELGPTNPTAPSLRAEKFLILLLTREERAANIVGDLAEEYTWIAAKHGVRFANLWYWKQVAASIWPFMTKAFRWGLLASTWEWVRRLM
jgi:sugar phosphate isomerase/epimerase